MAALDRRGPRLATGVFCLNEQGDAVYRSLHDRSQNQHLFWPRPYAPQDRALARQGQRRAARRYGGIAAAMVVDTGATSVVLTYESAKAVGLPLELLEYNVDVQTASGQTKAARLWLDRMAIGKLVERSVPALVVPRGQMKTNLLGMSFLDRLESWEVRADRLMLHGYP